jgi:hypothetical protein
LLEEENILKSSRWINSTARESIPLQMALYMQVTFREICDMVMAK